MMLIHLQQWFRFFMVGLIFSVFGSAQTKILRFRHYTIGDGLSQNRVQVIAQDSTGFLWFGTADGLDRFDGYRFKTYKNDPFDRSSLSDRDVSSILHDNAGRCWVGTFNGGLNLLNGQTDGFIHFRHRTDQPESISNDSITVLYQDSEHRLWVGTNRGLDRIELPQGADSLPPEQWIDKIRFHHISASKDSTGLSDPCVTTIFEDRHGYLWVGTENGLNVTHPDSQCFLKYHRIKNRKDCLGWDIIRCIFEDASGELWVGTEYGGLNRLILPERSPPDTRFQKLRQAKFRQFLPEPGNPNSLCSDVVYSIFESPGGVLWIGTENGLNRFDTASGRFDRYNHDPDNPLSLSNNIVLSIKQDRSGLFWICTDGGLNTFHENQHQFRSYTHYPDNPNSLSNPCVWDITEDSRGDIWIGTSEGLNRFHPPDKSITRYFHDPKNNGSLCANIILSTQIDQDDMLWVGMNGYGLERAMTRSDRPPLFFHMDCSATGLGSEYILTLYNDRHGALWIGTWDNGLRKILPDDRKALVNNHTTTVPYIRFLHDPKNPDSISPNRIYDIYQDHTGALWIGTDGDGINVLSSDHMQVKDPSREPVRFAHFRHDPDDPYSLSHNIVMCIHEDRNGDLWFGTYGGGLNHYQRKKNHFLHYNDKDGLPIIRFTVFWKTIKDFYGYPPIKASLNSIRRHTNFIILQYMTDCRIMSSIQVHV